ncbi:MAG: hypothetical protein ACJA02_000654 [Myxococcota bacterium]
MFKKWVRFIGIITTKNINWQSVQGFCAQFAEEYRGEEIHKKYRDKLLKSWEKAVEITVKTEIEDKKKKAESEKKDGDTNYTYYFLDQHFELPFSLIKNKGKSCIPSQIPKNMCITFQELFAQTGN